MHRQQQNQLVAELKKQRALLDDLIVTVGEAAPLDSISRTYDKTTRTIEKNLLALRKSFFKTK